MLLASLAMIAAKIAATIVEKIAAPFRWQLFP
jgi:hypothetical protein